MTPLALLLAISPPVPAAPYEADIVAAVADVAAVYVVPPELVRAIIRQESNFNPRARSSAGAIGLMQVMPFNAARVGVTVKQLSQPRTNILAGVRLLAVLLKYYGGDIISALVGYNARPRTPLAKLPRNGETPLYVRRVLAFYREYRAAGATDGGSALPP